jgi:hypothetical protein
VVSGNSWYGAAGKGSCELYSLGHEMDAEHYISYFREEVNHEIARLKAALRSPRMTEEEHEVALAMLEFYEDARMAKGESSLQY